MVLHEPCRGTGYQVATIPIPRFLNLSQYAPVFRTKNAARKYARQLKGE
jgi:hypothetical protein